MTIKRKIIFGLVVLIVSAVWVATSFEFVGKLLLGFALMLLISVIADYYTTKH